MYVFVTPSGTALLAELSICAGRAKTELSTALANEIRWAAVNCVGTTPAVPLDAEALLLAWRCVLCVRPPKAMVRAGRSASDTTWTERGMMILSSGFFVVAKARRLSVCNRQVAACISPLQKRFE